MAKQSKPRKSKKNSEKTYKKCVKQFSIPIEEELFDCLAHDVQEYQHCRNYIYSRYSGISSMPFLNHHRTLIRDSLMRTDKERIQAGPARKEAGITKGDYRPVISWQLLARHWKLALDDAVGGIKAEWSNTKNRVRDVIRNHADLNEDEKHFCYWVLCNDQRIYHVLKRHRLSYPDSIRKLDVNRHNLLNRIRRWFRNKKGKTPYSFNQTSYQVDSGLYRYEKDQLGNYIDLSVWSRKGERIRIYLRDSKVYTGNLCILLHPENRTIEIHALIKAKAKKQSKKEKNMVFIQIEGADKGMTEMLHLSNGHVYGKGLGKYRRIRPH